MPAIDAFLAGLDDEGGTPRRLLEVPVPSIYGPSADEERPG